MQKKTKMRYPFMAVRVAIIKMSAKNKCCRWCGEKGIFLHCWWECKLVLTQWRTVWRFLKKLKIQLPYVPEIPFLGEKHGWQEYMHPNVNCSVVYNSQDMEAT